MVVGMELLERNRSHGETGRGMMGDYAGCPGHPGRDRLGRTVVVGMTHSDGFGGWQGWEQSNIFYKSDHQEQSINNKKT